MEVNLFEIRLNDKTEKLLPRIYNWAKFFYICTIVTCILDFINACLLFRMYMRMPNISQDSKAQAFTDITFLIIYAILVPLQAYYLFKFCKKANRSIAYSDSEEFNSSFQMLLRHAMIAALLFLFNSVWLMIVTFITLKNMA